MHVGAPIGRSEGGAMTRHGRNIAIQQLRGIAILLVLMQHLSLPNSLIAAFAPAIANPGYAGVELFFVISGLVVTRTLQANGWSAGYFLCRRVFRLYPPILVFLLVSLGVVLLANSHPEGHVARVIFGAPLDRFAAQAFAVLTGTFLGLSPIYVNGAMWSLSVEFQFYVAIAVLLGVFALAGLDHRRIRAALRLATLAFLVAMLATRFGLLAGVHLPVLGWLAAWKFDFMLAGMLVALFLPDGATAPPRARAMIAGSILLALAILAANRSPLAAPGPVNWLDGLAMPAAMLLFTATVALAALLPDGLGGHRGRLGTVLNWVGDRSYTIYLLHFPILALLWFGLMAVAAPVTSQTWPYGIVQALAGLVLIFAAAGIAYRVVEAPAIRLGGRLIAAWRRPSKEAAMIPAPLRSLALLLPPLRRLVESRDAALQQVEALRGGTGQRATLDALLAAARPGSFFRTTLNGAPVELPVETLRTMVHCIHVMPDRSVQLWVETAHLTWMQERLAPGGTFLDVGAATGATALPTAHRFGQGVRIIAYEPATAARALLEATLARNAIGTVEVRPFAVSDAEGEAAFREYLPDETGTTPWMPETSSLMATRMSEHPSGEVRVRVVTLDRQMAEEGGFTGPVVVKIDVEGFEAFVLRGASQLIARHRPALAIDIHQDPFGVDDATTEAAVRAVLEPSGYACRMLGHVLLCSPG